MSSTDSAPSPPAPSDQPSQDQGAATQPKSRTRLWGAMLLAGAVSGLVGWQSVEQLSGTYKLAPELSDIGPPYSDEVGLKIETALREVILKNRILVLSVIGLVSGGLLGLAAGFGAPGRSRMGTGMLVGVLLGGGAGAAAAVLGQLAGDAFGAIGHSTDTLEDREVWNSYRGMVIHATTWSLLGLGYGIGASVAARSRIVPSALGAFAAGVIWGALFPFLGAVLFPQGSPEAAIPEETGLSILWTVGGTLLIAVVLCRVTARPPSATVATTRAASADAAGEPGAS